MPTPSIAKGGGGEKGCIFSYQMKRLVQKIRISLTCILQLVYSCNLLVYYLCHIIRIYFFS